MKKICFCSLFLISFHISVYAKGSVKIGFNYPVTGPYAVQGLDQLRGALIAVEEINSTGGVFGKNIELIITDTKTNSTQAAKNAIELIQKHKVKMIFGGVSSSVAIAVGKICQQYNTIFMGTITASNATTREEGHRHTFRVCFNAWMGARALASYLSKKKELKKYCYIVADYSWGWSSEESMRKFTKTEDAFVHKTILTRLGADKQEFKKAVQLAKMVDPDVVVMVLFGADMAKGLRQAANIGLKKTAQIVVPLLELGIVENAGPEVMEGVIGATDWNWQVPYKFDHAGGKRFVEKFVTKYNRYPCWGASTAYTNLHEYAKAVKRAGSLKSKDIIKAFEGHKFVLLKDEQTWRSFDHQCVQSVYVARCNSKTQVLKNALDLDYFDILDSFSGDQVVQTREEWEAARNNVSKPPWLEPIK